MINALLPDNNKAERLYAAEYILVEYLGLSVNFVHGQTPFSAELTLPNGKMLLLEDHFFHQFPEPLTYLDRNNLPKRCDTYERTAFKCLVGKTIPILFGNNNRFYQSESTRLGLDVFASAFFMLSRWEEYVNPIRDMHDRFPVNSSFAYLQQFLHIPIVDLYAEIIWENLLELGYEHPRKNKQFIITPTHDIDQALMWPDGWSVIKKIGGDIFKRHDIREALFSIQSGIQSKLFAKKDPYDSFDYLMDKSDKSGLQSIFYFLCGGKSKYDNSLPLETPFMKDLISKIQDRGHIIGLHPSYESFKDPAVMEREKRQLEQASGFSIRHSRQHFLRFEVPSTWQLLEDLGIEWDSSMYYPEQAGFRCGTCRTFPVFNILTRKKLRLKEKPLIAMDVSWTSYHKATPAQMQEEIFALLEMVDRFNGEFVLLWHNSNLKLPQWKDFEPVYEEVLNWY